MPRLPQPGGDEGSWGAILNEYLSQTHNSDGTLKTDSVTADSLASDAVTASALADGSVSTTQIADGSVSEIKLATSVQTKLNQTTGIADGSVTKAKLAAPVQASLDAADAAPTTLAQLNDTTGIGSATNNQVLSYNAGTNKWVPNTITSSTVSDATNASKGIVQLAGDLSGSATAPTVSKINGVAVTGTPSTNQVLTATSTSAATWATVASGSVSSVNTRTGAVTLSKSDVGLSNADNTSDAQKPVSTATQTALNAKLNSADLDTQTAAQITTNGSDTQNALEATFAPLASPAFTGTPTINGTAISTSGGGGEQGPPGLVWRGTYSGSTTYAKNDAVYYSGRGFIALEGNTGVTPPSSATSTSTWSVLVDKGDPGPAVSGVYGDSMSRLIAGGETNYSRMDANSNSIALTSGVIMFGPANVAQTTETITNVAGMTGGATLSGTTYAGYAVYSVSDSGDLTLVAQTANDTANLWNITFQGIAGINVKKAFTSSFQKIAGTRYTVAALYVGSGPPQLGGSVSGIQDIATNFVMPFRAAKSATGQTGFPSTIARGSMTGHSHALFFALLTS